MEIIDVSNTKECRICFIDENMEPTKSFINPCACSGTSKWVHLECLNRWRNEGSNPSSDSKCSECLTEYNIIQHNLDPEILIYKISYIKNLRIIIIISSSCLGIFLYPLDDWFFNKFLFNIISLGNKEIIDIVVWDGLYPLFYFYISSFIIFNAIVIYLIINMFKYVKNKKIYFNAIRNKIFILFFFNIGLLPIFQIGSLLKSFIFIISLYTILISYLLFIIKSLLLKSNYIIKYINDANFIEDTILPYPITTNDYIELNIETSETLLLPHNYI